MDEPSFYGFPTYGEATVKAGQDVGGQVTTASARSFEPNADNLMQLTKFMATTFPGSAAEVLHSVTCLYTLTPDRDFVVAPLPEHADIVVGLGAGHGFKFAPTFGRLLADLAVEGKTGSDIAAFTLDRPAITDPEFPRQLARLTTDKRQRSRRRRVCRSAAGSSMPELGGRDVADPTHHRRLCNDAVVHGRLHGEPIQQRRDSPRSGDRVWAGELARRDTFRNHRGNDVLPVDVELPRHHL